MWLHVAIVSLLSCVVVSIIWCCVGPMTTNDDVGHSSFGCHIADSDVAPGLCLIISTGGRGCVNLPGLVVMLMAGACCLLSFECL